MEQFFGVPTALAGFALGLAFAAIVGIALVRGGRGAPLLKLGLRNLPRRPVRAALIVFGLTLATTTISAAFGTGDTISATLRALVTETLGTTDEALVVNPPRQSNGDRARALATGTFGGMKAADLGFFPQRQYDQLNAQVAGNDAIAALAPAIADQVTVVLGAAGETRTAVGLLATHTPASAFGTLRSLDDAAISLEDLPPESVIINSAAATLFGVTVDQTFAIQTQAAGTFSATNPPADWAVTVAAIVPNGGIGGAAPLIIAPLSAYQRVLGREAQINQILVANTGGRASVARSDAATSALRGALVDRAVAQSLKTYLARPETQRGLLEAEAALRGRDRSDLAALRVEAAKPELTPRFISLASDPRVRRQLAFLTSQLSNFGDRRALLNQIRSITTLSVIAVKQEGLEQADEYGNVVTTVFLVLGIFSLGAAILLIHLIFTLLAADRAAELATMRALGMSQRQIGAIFLSEGLAYALLGATFGALAGIFATRLTVASLAEALTSFGYRLELRIEPRSIILAFLAGILLTFLAMCVSAWRVSRAQIIAATRGEERAEGRGLGGIALGVFLVVAAAWVWQRWHEPSLPYLPRDPVVLPGVHTLALIGASLAASGGLQAWQQRRADRLRATMTTVTGLALTLIWLHALSSLPTPGGETRADAIVTALGGLILIATSVWTATRGLAPLLKGLDRALSPLARLRLIVRPAAAYLAAGRSRTALTVTMFGMVVFIMVAALTMIETLVDAYAGQEPPVAGFDLRGDLPATAATTQPLTDMAGALATATGVRREAFGAIGGITTLDVRTVQFDTPRAAWRNAAVVAADDGFLGGVTTQFERRAQGYADDAAVWQAVRENAGLAVVTGSTASTFVTPPAGDGAFVPFTVWARATEGGTPRKLTIIGITAPRAELTPGIWASRITASGLGVTIASPTTYYFALAPGTTAADAIAGLKVSFAANSLVVTDLSTTLRIGQSVRALLTQLVQGFMGLGLIAGVAALGILGIQSVIERRQQLGTLRALGYTRGQTQATLAFESAITAALGISLGATLGLVLSRSLVTLLAVRAPEIRYAVPWEQIGLTILLAWLGTLGALAIAAWQAGRVSPADALRPTG
ncbi:MAG TPA: FtsX-like permease family protein [Thermomicrobiales bacterium]|jgi:putative ABC transport system permease protein